MKKWWRKLKNRMGWDFSKKQKKLNRILRNKIHASCGLHYSETMSVITDPNGCYIYQCRYCGKTLEFPWRDTVLAYHNMQRHIKAKHIDTL